MPVGSEYRGLKLSIAMGCLRPLGAVGRCIHDLGLVIVELALGVANGVVYILTYQSGLAVDLHCCPTSAIPCSSTLLLSGGGIEPPLVFGAFRGIGV